KLTKEFQTGLNERRRAAYLSYKNSIQSLLSGLEKDIERVAIENSKSIRKVSQDVQMARQVLLRHSKLSAWNAFTWKKTQNEKENARENEIANERGPHRLPHLAKNSCGEYHKLTNEQKQALLDEYAQTKAVASKGVRVSARSKVNDASQTLEAIETMLDNLCSRTGLEALLFATRGSLDMPLKGVTYATPGVEEFLQSTMKIDTTDFLAKMEGFALQGLKAGVVQNHQQRRTELRTSVRNEVTKQLRDITGVNSARMEWKHYFRNVVKRYSIEIQGWPGDIPLEAVGDLSCARLEDLLKKLSNGVICWKKLTEDELAQREEEHALQIQNGDISASPPRRPRSDKGKKRKRTSGA
ncbi:hypothetical protein F5887DRAFT_838566, partial [Amanita rubescens]